MKNFDEKEYLEYLSTKKLSDETKKTYLLRLKYFEKNRNNLKDKDKKYLNQIKQAVKYFYNMQDIYYNNDTMHLSKLHDKAKRKKREPEDTLHLKKINQKINLLDEKDKRKKLAFRLQEISGLRIAEISDLEKDDLKFIDGNRIIVTVRNGKGGKRRVIKAIRDKYVWEELQKLEPRKNNKLFHSKSSLMKKAQELDFNSHRLRKVFADQINYKFVGTEKERIILLQKSLGHEVNEKNRTHKRYTGTNIDYTGTKFDIS